MDNKNENVDMNEERMHRLSFIINDVKHEWESQYITGIEIRKLGSIPKEKEIFLAIKRPWEDEPVDDETIVDLARPGIEHFFSKKPGEEKLVSIHINNNEYKISRGKHTVVELKKIGSVTLAHEMEEKIDGKLIPLDDNASILIKGGEEFFSHPRDGSSS